MRVNKRIALAVALSLAGSSIASTAIAAPQQGAVASAPAPKEEAADGSKLRGGFLIPLIALIGGGLAIYFAVRHHNHNGNSP